jgi:hypothetical protein
MLKSEVGRSWLLANCHACYPEERPTQQLLSRESLEDLVERLAREISLRNVGM